MKKTFFYALKSTVPILAGYAVLGIGFGLMMYNAGYSWLWSGFMSLWVYAGSLQFAGLELMVSGAGLASAAVTAFVVNIRHLFYGISMLEPYRDTGRIKPYLIFSLTDENFSLAVSAELPADIDRKMYFFWISVLDHAYWVLAGIAGGLIGQMLPFSTEGVDFAMTALFATVAIGQWENTKNHIPALVGFGSAILFLVLLGPDRFLLPTMVMMTAALILLRPVIERREAVKNEP